MTHWLSASTPEKNYGEVGYKANNRGEELPAKGYSIDIPERTEDVTAQVTRGTERLNGRCPCSGIKERTPSTCRPRNRQRHRPVRRSRYSRSITVTFITSTRTTRSATSASFTLRQRTSAFTAATLDNFEWTRHDGDFTFMRAYVAPDGKSAEYSASNVPYKPKKYLTLEHRSQERRRLRFCLGLSGRHDAISREPKRRVCPGRQFPFHR